MSGLCAKMIVTLNSYFPFREICGDMRCAEILFPFIHGKLRRILAFLPGPGKVPAAKIEQMRGNRPVTPWKPAKIAV